MRTNRSRVSTTFQMAVLAAFLLVAIGVGVSGCVAIGADGESTNSPSWTEWRPAKKPTASKSKSVSSCSESDANNGRCTSAAETPEAQSAVR